MEVFRYIMLKEYNRKWG